MLKSKVDLSSSSKKGFFWSFIENFSKKGLHFIIGIILARLLTPADYGLIGMCTIIISFGNIFVDSGFGIALIRKVDCTQEDFNTVFYFNILISIFFYCILYFTSPFIAEFFQIHELINLIRVLSLSIVFSAFGIIQRTILTKEIDFKSQSKAIVFSLVISGSIGILLAFKGYGVWSLIIQSLLLSIFTSIFYFHLSSWRPKFIFSFKSFKSLFAFSSNLLISDIINILFKNSYYIIIGKFFTAMQLGLFTRAETTVNLLVNNFTNTVKRASYPVLAKIQNDEDSLKLMYRKLIKNTFLIFSSLILGLASTAESFVLILLGEKWLECVPYIQLLCFIGYFMPLTIFNLNAINVKGQSKLYLKLQIFQKIINVPAIFIAYYFGIIEMLLTMILVSFIYYLVNSAYSNKLIKYNMKERFSDILPFVFVSIFVNLIVYQFNNFDLHYILIFTLQVLVALILTYLSYSLLKQDEFLLLKKNIINKTRNYFYVKK